MTSLVEVLNVSAASNALTGVKRPLLGNPTTVPTQLPAFRGAPNKPGDAIKVPKLSAGNRQDRGTNVTIPVARVTPLTSVHIQNGRLSPGDVCFVRRIPGGFHGAIKGGNYPHASGVSGHMCDMFGVDGINRMLAGSIDGTRPWRVGYNLFWANDEAKVAAMKRTGFANNPLTLLEVLKLHTLDGVVLSNEEPHSFSTTEGRDATVFNVAVKGPAPTNNGFLNYESHKGQELYARGHDSHAFHEVAAMTSERAGNTWHGKIGNDFVAAFTNNYTEYPRQMFDRHPQVLDRAYLMLRKYNLWKDVIEPEINRGVPQAKALARVKVLEGDDNVVTLTKRKAKNMFFFQYIPCTSRAFQLYKHTRTDVTYFKHTSSDVKEWRKEKMDSVRYEDVANCVGAWCIGRILDTDMARAEQFAAGPRNSSYRMQVNVEIKWMQRGKTAPQSVSNQIKLDAMKEKVKTPYMFDIVDRPVGSDARKAAGMYNDRSLGEVELHEPVGYSTTPTASTGTGKDTGGRGRGRGGGRGGRGTASSGPRAPIWQTEWWFSDHSSDEEDDEGGSQAGTDSAGASQTPSSVRTTTAPVAAGNTVAPSPTAAAAAQAAAAQSRPSAHPVRPQPTNTGASRPAAQPTATAVSASSAATAPPTTASRPVAPAPPTRRSTMVDEVVDAAKRKALVGGAKQGSTAANRASTGAASDGIFETIFGGSAPVAPVAPGSSTTPTPSTSANPKETDSAPMTFSRRSR
jgi:hypothetical protein